VAVRTITSRAVTVPDLPPATAELVRAQAAAQGLAHDPLPDVTHGLRAHEETTKRRLFGTRTVQRTTDLLLTPELLVLVDHDEPAGVRVGFHRLDQLDFSAAPAELLAKATGMPVDVPRDLLPMTSTPLGDTRRATRYVRVGTGPDVAAFRAALTAAVDRTRPGPGT
jgi:hypothetical protein